MSFASITARRKQIQSRSVIVEPLESRTHFDLVPTIVAGLPTSVIATEKNNSVLTVDLTNSGTTAIKGAYALELFASPDGSLSDATPIVTINRILAPLASGQTRITHVALGNFPLVTNGGYNILAKVTGPLAGAALDAAAPTPKVEVVDPFVDLTATITSAPSSLKPGARVTDVITVTNQGNVAAKGPLEIQLGTSLNSDGSESSTFALPVKNINLAAGRHESFAFVHLISVGTTPDLYFDVVTIDPNDAFSESNTSNNFAVTSAGLTVLDPYPNMIGAYSGPYDFFAGVSRGTTGTLNVVITSEDDTTGEITGTGASSNGADFTFTGAVATNGVIHLTGDNSGELATLTGRFANGKFTGAIDIPDKSDRGEFSLTE